MGADNGAGTRERSERGRESAGVDEQGNTMHFLVIPVHAIQVMLHTLTLPVVLPAAAGAPY